MLTNVTATARKQGDAAHIEPYKYSKKIGSTTYVVAVHFSQTSRETIQDKALRLIMQEVSKTA